VLSCVNQDVIEVIDLRHALSELRDNHPGKYQRLYVQGHMTEEGNYFVAEIMSEAIAN